MQWRPLLPHSAVLPLFVLKYRDEPLKEHPRGCQVALSLYAVVSLRPSARAAASQASAVSMYSSHVPDDRGWSATPC